MQTLVLILGLLTAFGPLSIDMYLPALSAIATNFDAPISEVQLSLSSFFVGLAIGQVFYGPATDRWGRKKPLYFGLVLYVLASFACANANSAQELIAYRFLQALGSCAGMVISRAVVRDKFDARDSAKVFSLLMLIMGIAPILAPLIGGALLEHWGWCSIFWLLGVLSALALVASALWLPETFTPAPVYEKKNALRVYWDIAKGRKFLAYTLSGALIYSGMFAYITGSPFVFIEHFKLSPGSYSILFGSNAAGLIFLSQLNGQLLKKLSPQNILKIVFPISALLGLALLLSGVFLPKFEIVVALLFLFVASLGMIFPNATACALAGQKHAGSASALLGTLQFAASALLSAGVSYFHNDTIVPMCTAVGLCALGAYIVYKGILKTS